VHYLGDEEVAVPFPHRNAKGESIAPFIRTAPSYLNTLRESVKAHPPSTVYKREVATVASRVEPAHIATCAPRNTKQLRNLHHHALHINRLSHDDKWNIHTLAYDLHG
jgi:hypothetical protein